MPGLNLLTRRQSELAIDVFRSFDLAGAPTLTKRGKTIHHVVLRIFVLADGFIFYFKSPSATEPSGLIPIQGSEFKMHKYVAGHEKLNMCFELRTPVRAWGSIVLHYHGCTEEKADAVIATLEASGGKRIVGDFSEFHDHLEHQAGAQENHHDDIYAKAATSPTLPRYDPHEEAMPALQLLYSTKRGQSQQNLLDLQWSSLREHGSHHHHHHSDSAGSLKCLAAAIENDNARVEATLDISNELCHDLCTTGEATRSFGHLSLGVHTHSLGRIHHVRSRSSSSSTASYAEGDVRSKRESLVVMSSGVDVKPHDTRVVQAISLAESYSGSFSLRQYTPLKLIGKGGFGQVIVARHNETHNLVAIKTLSKHALTAQNQVAHTKAERNVLIKCYNHPFIVKLHAAFQTIDHLHMVLDYCPGGELFFHLSKVGRFTEPEAAFYASEIFLALDHLHAHAIIYRDLKPENVLLDRDGHVRLADFGLSKEDVSGRKLAATFCGSAEYISPELLALADGADGGGYDKGVDIWALGCLIFELLTGLPPFYSGKCRAELYARIRDGYIAFPDYLSEDAKDLVTRLLHKEPTQRLGYASSSEIKTHAFFASHGHDWETCMQRKCEPPRRPSPVDYSNFDAAFTSVPLHKEALEDMAVFSKRPIMGTEYQLFDNYNWVPDEMIAKDDIELDLRGRGPQ